MAVTDEQLSTAASNARGAVAYRDRLIREAIEDGWSIRRLSELTGIHRNTIRNRAVAQGRTVRVGKAA